MPRPPRLTTLEHFVEDSQLWLHTKPPSKATLNRWLQDCKIITTTAYGQTYIDLHATLKLFQTLRLPRPQRTRPQRVRKRKHRN